MAQTAWLMNASLKENIMFGQKFDPDLYDKVIESCALKADIAQLRALDNTEIREKVGKLLTVRPFCAWQIGSWEAVIICINEINARYVLEGFLCYLQGINLSGGQKKRVSLGRALYSGADVVLLVSFV